MNLDEIFKQNSIVTIGLERLYCVNLSERRWDLDFCTPVYLFVETELIKARSWVQIIKEMANYLQSNHPLDFDKLLSFRTDWSKAEIYSKNEFIKNVVKLECGLYLSVNYTGLHSSWIISDLLKLYEVNLNDCLLVVHKSPKAEASEIRDEIEKFMKTEFRRFLITEKGKNNETTSKIINSFNLFNKLLDKKNTSYNNFFLFDNAQTLSNYKSSFVKDVQMFVSWNEKQVLLVKKYLDYLTEFYTFIGNKIQIKEREENKHLLFTKPNGTTIKLKTAKKA